MKEITAEGVNRNLQPNTEKLSTDRADAEKQESSGAGLIGQR